MTANAKRQQRRKPTEPTREQFRDWYYEQKRRASKLQTELDMARATIAAKAWTLAYRSHRQPISDDDIPF